MNVELSITGFEELYQKISQLEMVVQRKLMQKATKKGAEIIRKEAAMLAPVDDGDLRDGMTTTVDKDSGGGDVTVLIGPGKKQFYGHMQEFGTAHHTAHPFLQPALDSKGKEAIEVAGQEAWKLFTAIL